MFRTGGGEGGVSKRLIRALLLLSHDAEGGVNRIFEIARSAEYSRKAHFFVPVTDTTD